MMIIQILIRHLTLASGASKVPHERSDEYHALVILLQLRWRIFYGAQVTQNVSYATGILCGDLLSKAYLRSTCRNEKGTCSR